MTFIWIASIVWAVLAAVFCLAICAAARRETPEIPGAEPFLQTEVHKGLQLTPAYQGRELALELSKKESLSPRLAKRRFKETLRKGRASGNHRHQNHAHHGYQFSQS